VIRESQTGVAVNFRGVQFLLQCYVRYQLCSTSNHSREEIHCHGNMEFISVVTNGVRSCCIAQSCVGKGVNKMINPSDPSDFFNYSVDMLPKINCYKEISIECTKTKLNKEYGT
jgi:hypothetical protein